MNYFARCRDHLLDALLPQTCGLCRRATGSRDPLCPSCRTQLALVPSASCPVCADFSGAGNVCGRCLRSPPAFSAVIPAFLFNPPLAELLHRYKYAHHLRYARWFGEGLSSALNACRDQLDGCDGIVAMPLHPARLRARGFNQSVEMARPLTRALGLPLLSSLVMRTRDTPAQANLPVDQRRRNLRGAFECQQDLTGRSLLIVDDVVTTGSSVDELARTLRLHGAGKVIVACLARVQSH